MNKKITDRKTQSPLTAALLELCKQTEDGLAIKALQEGHAALCEKVGLMATLSSHETVAFKEGLNINFKLKKISRMDVPVFLCPSEWKILEVIVGNAGAPASKEHIAQALYSDVARESNVIEVYISKLREKIGRDAILTMRGIGYVMA
jgi:DNA-binding response OmpR family regulator